VTRKDRHTRRWFLVVASTAATGVAGCLGESDDDSGDEPAIPADQQELIEAFLDELGQHADVEDWSMFGDQFVPRYVSGNSPEEDIPMLGAAYAGIVEEGFEFETMPTALDEDGIIDWMVYIFPEWAEEYLEGEMSEEEYHTEIRETIH